MNSLSRDASYVVLKSPLDDSYPASPSQRSHDRDSEDSLRALELSDGPIAPPSRGRSFSVSGFNFQHDLLPLSTSLSDPDNAHDENGEKSISLVNGK